jgi:hypothetical protein
MKETEVADRMTYDYREEQLDMTPTQLLLIAVAGVITALMMAVVVVGLVRRDLDPGSAGAMLGGVLVSLVGVLGVLGKTGNGNGGRK